MVAAGVAVAAVGAGILAMNVAAGDSPPATSGPTVGGDAAPVPVVTPSVRPSASAATSAPTATTATTATTAPAGAPAAAPAATSAPAAPVSSVTVLNATSIRGLAARQAGVIEAAGWPVRRVTGVRARVGATTVYYDPAQRSQATALVSAVPSITRALPRPRWLLPTGGLIVVVARDAA